MHRLALALGQTLDKVDDMPAKELHAWRKFDRQCGLPDVAAQWQRALLMSSKAKPGTDIQTFMPLIAWNKPSGAAALLEMLKNNG
jgi:hypothetical protein